MPSFTRQAIMKAFMQLLEERPLNKITVKDIVEVCGINRNTFYYHFEDIPSLIEAIVKEETEMIAKQHSEIASVQDALEIAVSYILKQKKAALHVFQSANRDIYERYLMQLCQYVVETYFAKVVGDRRINPEDVEIIIRSCRCWCFGLLIDWMNTGLREDILPLLKRLCELREGAVEEMLSRCRPA